MVANNVVTTISNLILENMDRFKETLLYLDSNEIEPNQIVSILILSANKLDINTISEMARQENKTPRGITISNQYRKINIGKQKFAIKGISETNLPF
jgi:hypothetical protein